MATQTKVGLFSLGIRQKIVFVLITILLLSLGLSSWQSIREQEALIIEETRLKGQDLAKFTSQSVVYAVVAYDYHSIQLLLNELTSSRDINYAKVINSKGSIMAKAGRLSTEGDVWTYFEQEIIFDDTHVGTLSIQLDNSRIVEKLVLQQNELIQREILLILLIALVEYIALSFFIIRPIVCTSNSIKKSIKNNDPFNLELAYKANDELGYLFAHFNTLQQRLSATTDKLRSKVAFANKEMQAQNERLQLQSDELKSFNEKLRKLSVTDPLTELFNRRHFDILLKKEISFAHRNKESVSLVLFDIDHFKSINDKYGHSVGDAVLCAIAKNTDVNTRDSDICCRVGGEEFAIICRNTDMHQVRVLAEHIREKLEQQPVCRNQHEIHVTASFGVMTFSSIHVQELSSDNIYHCADIAMYHSKNHGRNRVTHYADINTDIPRPYVHNS